MGTGYSKTGFSTEGFEILFNNDAKWKKTRGLATKINSFIEDGFFHEYCELNKRATVRGNEDTRNIFEDSHDGTIEFTEKLLAKALWNMKILTLPDGKGCLRLLDYEFPLRATGNDRGIGEVDLLGLTDGGALTIVELKYLKEKPENQKRSPSPSDSPLFALVEALRYSVFIKKNMKFIKEELASKKSENENDQRWVGEIKNNKSSIILMANERWWQYWQNPPAKSTRNAMGEWENDFDLLLEAIWNKLGIRTECYAINDYSGKDLSWKEGNKPFLKSDPQLRTCIFG
ncbi:MAG: hypothetical protein OXG88_00515 [Gammaproteobacteria bacterium]|nr:hypothetical protein [Gammaproteobacteria bacterium]MDE2739552.1 hypothetical protein [Paracoccaceae bacterium]